MNNIDRNIAKLIQVDGKLSSAEIAASVGISVSSANERVRKLKACGALTHWKGILNPKHFGVDLLVFIFVDMTYEGEYAACNAMSEFPEVQEIHHISGPHSYLLKVRVENAEALQLFLQNQVKPLSGVIKTETLMVLNTPKETTEIQLDLSSTGTSS